MLEVLFYLFQNYLHPKVTGQSREMRVGSDDLAIELTEIGFDPSEILRAFHWLEGILNLKSSDLVTINQQPPAIRYYSEQETKKLSLKSRGFLLSLEHAGVLDQSTRELVIDRAMALEINEINIDGMQWVVFMVLLNQPQKTEATEETVAWLESAILEPAKYLVH